MTLEEYEALMARVRAMDNSITQTTSLSMEKPMPKPKKRKRSKYNRELSRQLKLLKIKHPRTPQNKLMSKAHKATRKALKQN